MSDIDIIEAVIPESHRCALNRIRRRLRAAEDVMLAASQVVAADNGPLQSLVKPLRHALEEYRIAEGDAMLSVEEAK